MALAGVGTLVGENPPGLVDVGDAGDGSSGSAAFARAAAASEGAGDLWVAPPAWATWHARVYKADVTGDGVPDGVLVGGGRFELWAAGGEGTEPVFSSPDEWLVSDGRVADLDGDGLPEVVLLVWRAANFGSSRPFWVEEPEDGEDFDFDEFDVDAGELENMYE